MASEKFSRVLLLFSICVLFAECVYVYFHHETLLMLGEKYLWVTPLIFFKSTLKKLLILNFYGLLQLVFTIFLHAFKLLFIKFLKTIGIRYGAYFSQQKWQKTSRRFRVYSQIISRKARLFQNIIRSLNIFECTIVVLAFLPLFIVMFLFGIGFRMTRDVMVKKGSEISVTNVAVKTAKKSHGLIARLKQADAWLLHKIALLTNSR